MSSTSAEDRQDSEKSPDFLHPTRPTVLDPVIQLHNHLTMPPKPSTRMTPIRLQTIDHLRVRRPNQTEKNPCETVMSSMLSTLLTFPTCPLELGYDIRVQSFWLMLN